MLFRRTDWFKVRTERGVEGWASEDDMLQTVLADGAPLHVAASAIAPASPRIASRWASSPARTAAPTASPPIPRSRSTRRWRVEGAVGQFLGRYSNGVTADIGLTHVLMPEWRWSPFLMLGIGVVHIEPKATLVQPSDRTEQTAYVGGGIRYYLTPRFFLRAEYKTHVVFTTRNRERGSDEWKLGFAFFF